MEQGLPEGETVVAGEQHLRVLDLGDVAVLRWLARGWEVPPGWLVVFSDEWAERRPQCEGFLRARAGLFERRLGARACTVRTVPRALAEELLERCHVYGASPLSLEWFGLLHGEELLGVLTLGRHPRQGQGGTVVLDRMCFTPGVQVVGGAARLFAHGCAWARAHGFDRMVSFSDSRLSPGTVYERMGFVRAEGGRPDYFYVRDGRRISKQSQRKRATGCPAGMTEREWATQRGLVRCYDAGKVRWEYDLRGGVPVTAEQVNSAQAARQQDRGVFHGPHLRGYFPSQKAPEPVYFGSSYELRCMFELEADPTVRTFGRGAMFQTPRGRWRSPDLEVERMGGPRELWEVKPSSRVGMPRERVQIADSAVHAAERGMLFRVWTERDSALGSDSRIAAWARTYLAEHAGDLSAAVRHQATRRAIRDRHYKKEQAASVTVSCAYCGRDHVVLPRTYARNIARHGGAYVCEALAGHIGGSKPKDALKKVNPYAAEGRKECSMCKAVLPVAEFQRRAKSWDGLSAACKPCLRVYDAARYQARKAHTSLC
jgi:hypothetical protein